MTENLSEEQAERIRAAVGEAVSRGVRASATKTDAGRGDSTGPGLMLVISAAHVAADHADALLHQSIAAARHAGHSWQEIGALLGVTRQAAHQRYGPAGAPSPGPRQRLLKPVTALNEMDALADAGRHGWHSVGFGMLYHLLEHSPQQWEHRREAFPLPGSRKRLEAHGWQHIGTIYPWQYLKRPLGTPALAEGDD